MVAISVPCGQTRQGSVISFRRQSTPREPNQYGQVIPISGVARECLTLSRTRHVLRLGALGVLGTDGKRKAERQP